MTWRPDTQIKPIRNLGKIINVLKCVKCFLKNRKQRVFLNGQISSWTNALAGAPQGSFLGPLFFLIYINDLSDDLTSNPLFSVAQDKNTSAKELNNNLQEISNWAYQWKISFNPDPLKQRQEVIFSRKITKINHSTLILTTI